jgi:hypothetical protein
MDEKQNLSKIKANKTVSDLNLSNDEWLAFEINAVDMLDEIVEKYGLYLEYVWRFGDGEGGEILRKFALLMAEKGHRINSPWLGSRKESCAYIKIPIPAALREEVFIRDDFRCVHCGSRRSLCADHIHPESLGGKAVLDNLQTLCRSCNSKKGKKVAK